MKTATKQWAKALIATIVTGGANNALAALGIGAANMVGIKIPALDLNQMGMIMLSGGLVGALAYLKQSPVPPDEAPIAPKAP